MLREVPNENLRVLVVWEPVLPTDWAPPTTGALSTLDDPRAIQYWDPERALSADIVRAVRQHPERYADWGSLGAETIIWDTVGLFPPGVRWSADIPVPTFHGEPVVQSVDELKSRLGISERAH